MKSTVNDLDTVSVSSLKPPLGAIGAIPLMLWQPLVTMTNSNTSNKSLSRISSGDHKRTQQGVSAELLSYLYKLHMVCAT